MTAVPIYLSYSSEHDQMFVPYEQDVSSQSSEEYLLPSFWENIFTDFEFQHFVAETQSSLVWKGTQKSSSEVVALKINSFDEQENSHQIHQNRETVFLKQYQLKSMAQVKQIIHVNHYRLLVMDYYPWNLSNIIQEFTKNIQKRYTQRHLNFVIYAFKSIITCVQQLHSLGYIHRDLKSDNFLVDQQFHVAMSDFGLVTRDLQIDESFAGTLQYLAPERLSKKGRMQPIQKSVDVWSLGIILYELFTGQAPFRGNTQNELMDQICEGYIFQKQIPSPAMSLIQGILQLNRQKRLTLDQIKQHPFLQKQVAADSIKIES